MLHRVFMKTAFSDICEVLDEALGTINALNQWKPRSLQGCALDAP